MTFIGDATHDESSQGLKKLVLGVAGTHFHNGKWQNTIIPIMFVVISQESKDILKLAMDALVACLRTRLDIELGDFVLGDHFPDLSGWAVRTLELLAFVPDPLFHVAMGELLRCLELAGQTKAVDYLRNSKSPCASCKESCVWRSRCQSCFALSHQDFPHF